VAALGAILFLDVDATNRRNGNSTSRRGASVTRISEWQQENGLEKYTARFGDHDIARDVLPHLTEADNGELGLPTGARAA
jgi:hypothetical protein